MEGRNGQRVECSCGRWVGLGVVDDRGGGAGEGHERLLSDMCDVKYPVS